ncbi:MAG TPA: helix-turn-helix domain-containing protein [Phycisphaerae bacterium]|nr:helix-turn-helix domain-containing protein [Phycisphaerae bacterium]
MSKSPAQLTVPQAAERLGLHRNRILQLIDAGSLPATRLGRWWVLLAADVEAFARLDRPAGNPNFGRKVKGS